MTTGRTRDQLRIATSIWGIQHRRNRWYIETREPRTVIARTLSQRMNAGGKGYATRAAAEVALATWLREASDPERCPICGRHPDVMSPRNARSQPVNPLSRRRS